MSNTLYDITAEMQAAFDQLYVDEDGVVQGMDALEAVTARFEDKAEAVACFIKQLEAEAEMLQAEEDALYKRRQAKEHKAVRLRTYLANCIQAAGRDRFETPRVECKFRRSKQVVVSQLSLVPEEFIKEDVRKSADKKAIRKYIEAGGEVPGADLVECQNLQVR